MTDPGHYPQQQYPQQNAQGYPGTYASGYGQPYAPPHRGMSITSLVLGLVSIFSGFTFIVPIAGLVFGFIGLRREPAGRGMAIAGVILNGVMLIGWVLLIVLAIVIFGSLAAAMQQDGFYA
ncbi:DUF4190 domain-containing protein [Arthrobacter sp.]|uniref:DUF4190 domain-containing protein n=1 Tax=Arthrobacter sp. TaxID=1667 RepID=UPI003A8E3516